MGNKQQQDPKIILQTAIEELDVFTQVESSRLEVGKNGRLFAAKESRLERVVGLARCYIGPIFSEQMRKEQEKKLLELKKAILRARDIIQSHSILIERFQEGDEAQRKLAESALLAIQRYNAIVVQDSHSSTAKTNIYNYERQRLLLDREIKGQQIELPYVISIKYDSHPNTHPAQKMLKELSQTLLTGAVKKTSQSLSPTPKKSMQFMIDTFHLKASGLIETHLQKTLAETVPLVKRTTPEIDEEGCDGLITMQQLIEVDAGHLILVTGRFQRNGSNSKFMAMPMPVPGSFRLTFELTHTGFPYPSQHTGWALVDKWIEAFPLRADQTPLFQKLNQRRKDLVHQLLFNQSFIQKARCHFKIKRDVFDQNRHIFLPLHRQLQQALRQNAFHEKTSPFLEAFYHEAANAPSAFDLLVQTQQQILNFIKQPIRALEEEWLGGISTPLRLGSPQEKFYAASLKLEQHLQQLQEEFDSSTPARYYILQQGLLLGKAFQSVGLQYQSEKMGFSPPFLNDFERDLQVCAFQQLTRFLDECEHRLDVVDPAQIKSDLLVAWSQDLQLFESSNEEEHSLPLSIVNELERYFNSRFYSPFYEDGAK